MAGRYLSSANAQEAVLGAALARNLKITVGGELTLLGSGKDGSIAATIVPVVGIFESGNPELDRHLVQLPLKTFQEVFSLGEEAHAIVVSGSNHATIPQTKAAVAAQLAADSKLVVLDWEQLIPGLKQLIQTDMVQNWITYIALILIVTLSIMNTFLMSVLERTREFGIMLALGASPRQIGIVVLLESLFLTVLGLVIGIVLGGGIAIWLHYAGFSFPGMKEIYAQYGLPGEIHPQLSLASFTLGPAVILVFTLLAALYPALRIRQLQPVEAIHAA
jgi:ABC-type lipoprotein release transport system permease subunit